MKRKGRVINAAHLRRTRFEARALARAEASEAAWARADGTTHGHYSRHDAWFATRHLWCLVRDSVGFRYGPARQGRMRHVSEATRVAVASQIFDDCAS